MVTAALRVARSALRVGWWAPSLTVSVLDVRVQTEVAAAASARAGTERATRNAQRATPLLIVALAAIVRLWGLGGQPVLYFDSGVYLGEGAFLASVAERAAGAFMSAGVGGVALALQDGTDAHPPDIAKPGHAMLLAVSMLVLGKSALAGALVSAVAGIGTVAATYAIGMRGWGPRVAIPAATLLAISGQHLVYSREPLVEADGLFFATLAALVYLRAGSPRGLLGAGVLWGVAFTCNNRLSFLPAVFFLAELAQWPGWRGLLKRGFLIGGGFLIPPAVIEAGYLAARGIGRAAGARTDWLDYAQQLAAFSRMNPPDRVRFDQWPTYFVDLGLMDGLGVLALLLVGIGVLAWRIKRRPWSRVDLLLAGSLLVPLALYSVYSTGEVRLRHFSLAIPWVMLAAALGLRWLVSLARRYDVWALVAAVSLLVVAAVPRVVALATAPSGMPAVLSTVGSSAVASTNGPVMAFYVGEDRTNARLREAFVNVPADLPPLAASYPLLVVDMQAEVFPGELTDLYARATPRLVVPNGNDTWYLADLLEHYGVAWGGWSDLLLRWQTNREAASQLRILDLRDLVSSRSGG
jgi:4-amino-4-deoxy-L-arabinose transferase-like glycosyltransferase